MCPKGCLQQGSLPTKLQATLADTFSRVVLLTGDMRCNGGLETRQRTASTACLGTCAVCFPHCKAQERGNVDAGGSHSWDGWAVQCGADLLHSQTQLMA